MSYGGRFVFWDIFFLGEGLHSKSVSNVTFAKGENLLAADESQRRGDGGSNLL